MSLSVAPPPKRRFSALVMAAVALVLMAVVGIVLWQMQTGPTVPLPENGSLHYLGLRQGTRIPAHQVAERTLTDMDGCTWKHSLPRLEPSLEQKVYEATPTKWQKHLPASWKPASPISMTTADAQLMLWAVSGNYDRQKWQITWLDKSGFESEGHTEYSSFLPSPFSPTPSPANPVLASGSLPPTHSPEVILRIRERSEGKPFHQWPLIAELPMKNPCLLKAPLAPIDPLPATQTQNGLALTLQSLTIDTNPAAYHRVGVRLQLPPDVNPQHWTPYLRIFDQRRMGILLQNSRMEPTQDGYTHKTSACLWTDAPWFVRVSLYPAPAHPSRPGTQFHFNKVMLPTQTTHDVFSDLEEARNGHSVSINALRKDGTGQSERLILTVGRSALPNGHRFSLVSIVDDLGRKLEWSSNGLRQPMVAGKGSEVFSIPAPSGAVAKSIDLTFSIDAPQVYDFCVMPELLRSTPQPK